MTAAPTKQNRYDFSSGINLGFEKATKRISEALKQKGSVRMPVSFRSDEKTEKNLGTHFHEHKLQISEWAFLLLLPLVEVAWANGGVTRREKDMILKAAAAYGLVENKTGYQELMEWLLEPPAPHTLGRMWQDLHLFLEYLPNDARRLVFPNLLAQAQFVAEQSAESVMGFLSDEKICRDEREVICFIENQLEKAAAAAEESDLEKSIALSIEKEKHLMKYDAFFRESSNADQNISRK